MYQALYRKWRSKTFSDVIGQEHITLALQNEVATGRTSHAYLFTGSRGTGKTTCAKILAKAVNCLEPVNGSPCCKCSNCLGIEDGSILDVLEIDAASNNGVDNIRDLRSEASFTPSVAKYRVYIIDEVHMLSTGAFNALLKIMEEPPPHVRFILATTELQKVPATILSRCQRFDFHRIDSRKIADRLLYVAQQEQVALEDEAAMLIARLSDGGMRDALSMLDLCISGLATRTEKLPDEEEGITAALVARSVGLAGRDHLFEIVDALGNGDTQHVFTIVQRLHEQSVDPQRLCESLLEHFRNLMLVKAAVEDPGELLLCMPEERERYRVQAMGWKISMVFYCMSVLQDTLAEMGRMPSKRICLEMALVKLCNPALDGRMDGVLARLERLEGALKSGSFVIQPPSPSAALDSGLAEEPPVSELKTEAPQRTVSQSGQIGESHIRQSPEAVQPELQAAPADQQIREYNAAGALTPPPDAEHPATEPLPAFEEPEESVGLPEMECWPQVMVNLAKINPALHGALAGSLCYIKGDLALIDAPNGLFLDFIRKNDYAKETLRQAIQQETGRRYRLGPYRRQTQNSESRQDPLDLFAAKAAQSGVKVTISGEGQ